MSRRCQMCLSSGRARKYQDNVVYLCQKHLRELKPFASGSDYQQACATGVTVVCADADSCGNDDMEGD